MAPRHFHFIGICGTAMGSVAAALKERGFTVSGSDENIYPPMSDFLRQKQVVLSEGFREGNVPKEADVLVIGNAIRRGNPELEHVLNNKLAYLSLPETLKQFFLRGRHNLVVTGTHGKTTTAALLAWVMECGGTSPGFMVGGLPGNFEQGALLRDSKFFVIEGDEYDTAFFDKRSKFIHYLPELLIINNIEFDHADIFTDLEQIKKSFRQLVNIVPGNGMILLNADDENCVDVVAKAPAPILEVGFSPNAGNQIRDVRYSAAGSEFVLFDEEFFLPMAGEYNVRNAAMAVSAAHFYGVPVATIREALKSFKGVHRRQEVIGEVRGIRIVDDFGHHPTAIRQTLESMRRQVNGDKRIWAVFEPRSNTTRRAVFQQSLPQALQVADGAIVSAIAKIEQIPEQDRLDPQRVIDDIREAGRQAFYVPEVDDIVERLRELAHSGDTIIIFSNGGFGGLRQKLLNNL